MSQNASPTPARPLKRLAVVAGAALLAGAVLAQTGA
jgi:hypothetical protein